MESKPLTEDQRQALRRLPAVEILLSHPSLQICCSQYSHEYVVAEARTVLEEARHLIRLGREPEASAEALALQVVRLLETRFSSHFRRVVNLTGTIIHTNLGRALLSTDACQRVSQVAGHYSNLEFDLFSGKRGHRDTITEHYLQELTGCEASAIVNNNAAAVLLTLNTLAKEREVIVSRGELIEIGGSFRIPDVMTASQALLCEVGTTNRTYIRDYEEAVGENTALLLKVHPSNYKVEGFSSTPAMEEVVALGQKLGIPTMEDLGSGALVDLRQFGLPHEPVVKERVKAGVDVVTFSGDKLLGGPQAGIIVGKKSLVDRIRRNPLMRALRVGKLTLGALEATLRSYLGPPESLVESLPMLGFLARDAVHVRQTAEQLAHELKPIFRPAEIAVRVEQTHCQIGSGSLPVNLLPSASVVLKPRRASVQHLASLFRNWTVPILGRIQDDQLYMDVRATRQEDIDEIHAAAQSVARLIGEQACVT